MTVGAASAPDDSADPLPTPSLSPLEALYRSEEAGLLRYVTARVGSGPPEPEEVVQAAFATLAAAGNLSEIRNPAGYLVTIAKNILLLHHRRAGFHRVAAREVEIRSEKLSEITPERVMLDRESVAIFEDALKTMPTLRKRVFLMVRVEDLTVREVAGRFGLSEDAVHKHVQRALKDCAEAFQRAERFGRRR